MKNIKRTTTMDVTVNKLTDIANTIDLQLKELLLQDLASLKKLNIISSKQVKIA